MLSEASGSVGVFARSVTSLNVRRAHVYTSGEEGRVKYVSDDDRVRLLVVGEQPQKGTIRRLCVLCG